MAEHTASTRITLDPHSRRVSILDGATLTANTIDTIALYERSNPHRPELSKKLPREDVGSGLLSTHSGHAGKGNMRGYCCYIAASIKIHSKISWLRLRYKNIDFSRSFKWKKLACYLIPVMFFWR